MLDVETTRENRRSDLDEQIEAFATICVVGQQQIIPTIVEGLPRSPVTIVEALGPRAIPVLFEVAVI